MDALEAIEIIELREYAAAFRFLAREDTKDEDVRRARIPERLVDAVFANIARFGS